MPSPLTRAEAGELRDLLDIAIGAVHDGVPVSSDLLEAARELAQQQLEAQSQASTGDAPQRGPGQQWYVVAVLHAVADTDAERAATRVGEACGPTAVYVGDAWAASDAQIAAPDFGTTVLHAGDTPDAAACTGQRTAAA